MISSHLLNFIMDLCFSHKQLLPSSGLCGLGTAIDYKHSLDVSKTVCILQVKPALLPWTRIFSHRMDWGCTVVLFDLWYLKKSLLGSWYSENLRIVSICFLLDWVIPPTQRLWKCEMLLLSPSFRRRCLIWFVCKKENFEVSLKYKGKILQRNVTFKVYLIPQGFWSFILRIGVQGHICMEILGLINSSKIFWVLPVSIHWIILY